MSDCTASTREPVGAAKRGVAALRTNGCAVDCCPSASVAYTLTAFAPEANNPARLKTVDAPGGQMAPGQDMVWVMSPPGRPVSEKLAMPLSVL